MLGCGGIGYYYATKDQTKEVIKTAVQSTDTSEDVQLSIKSPVIEEASSMEGGQKVTWDCLWFGSYPQKEITEDDGTIYIDLKIQRIGIRKMMSR